MWLPFENDNSSPSPGSQRSGNNTPRHKPPPFSPLRHGDNGSQPNNSAMPTIPIDPALVQAGFFGAEQAVSSLSHSLIQPSTGVLPVRPKGKEQCGRGTCSHQATASCSKGMCKTCCIRDRTSTCFYKGHNGGLRPISTLDDPFHLPRPIPSVPLLLPMSTSISKPGFPSSSSFPASVLPSDSTLAIVSVSTGLPAAYSAETEVNPFYFGKPVPPRLAADWNQHRQEREIRQQSEASRTENEQHIKHTVLLVAYLQDAADPIPLPLQDIKTWPTLNLKHMPHLAAQLGMQNSEDLELYACSNHGSFWIPTVDYSMSVKTDKKIFIRRKGVQTAHHPSTFVNPMALHGSPFGSAQTPMRKRARESPVSSTRPSKITHIDLTGKEIDLYSLPSSPLVAPSSPSPIPMISRSGPPLPLSCQVPLELDEELQVDQIWLSGSVVTPPDTAHVIWPQRVYACDMAQAFAFLEKGSDNRDLGVRFSQVFNGMTYRPSTYHLNQKFWASLPTRFKEEARTLPRTDAGLWTAWRKDKPGWK